MALPDSAQTFPHEVVIRIGKLRMIRLNRPGSGNSAASHIQAQYEWCCEPHRPGVFSRDTKMDDDVLALVYTFSDANTAFEFRMRFG